MREVTLKELAKDATYGTVGYIGTEEDLETLEQFILFNLPVLTCFNKIIVSTNYRELSFKKETNTIWKRYFPECILIDNDVNRGPAFGTADLDNLIFNHCKNSNTEWLFKSSNDVLITENFLEKKVPLADFYYYIGISYEDLYLNSFDYSKIQYKFFPQTNGYFINVQKCDYLVTQNFLDETFKQVSLIKNYNNKPWEYIEGWSCELFLANCVMRNNLSKHYLLSEEKHNKLCRLIEMLKIGDPSHKNIWVDGLCHFQYPNLGVYEI